MASGLPPGLDLATSSSLGLKLADTLSVQLGGKLVIESRDGVSVSVRFPLPRTAEACFPPEEISA